MDEPNGQPEPGPEPMPEPPEPVPKPEPGPPEPGPGPTPRADIREGDKSFVNGDFQLWKMEEGCAAN